MKQFLYALPAALILAGCSSAPAVSQDLSQRLQNPLYAERYYDSLVDFTVNLELQEDPLSKDEAAMKLMLAQRAKGLELAREASEHQLNGLYGNIVSDYEYAVGEALLFNGVLYMGTDFETVPGPDLHVYLSTALDPRDGEFPDESAIDLGVIGSAFGAHSYNIPEGAQMEGIRSLALYDTKLKRIFGFAQMQVRSQ